MKIILFATLMVLGLLVSAEAQARTRDDVMGGAFRCEGVGDGRQWLDCYYGAAQPMRAALQLPPANAAQIAAAARAGGSGQVPESQARVRDAVMGQAFQCGGLNDDRQWLNCYYGAAQPMRAALGLSPAPQASMAVAAPPAPAFGLPPPPAPAAAQDEVVSRLSAYRFNSAGGLIVSLENGQTWRQIDGDTAIARLRGPAGKYVATIKHGFFRSYNLTIRTVPGLFRMQRVS